jgi:hypothetical protein
MQHGELTLRRIETIRANPDKTVRELAVLTGLCDGNVRSLIYKYDLPFRKSMWRYPFEQMDWRLDNRFLVRIWRTRPTTISTRRPRFDQTRERYADGSKEQRAAIAAQERLAAKFHASSRRVPHRSVLAPYRGQRKTIKQWSGALGIPCSTISCRLNAGWPVAKVLGQRRYPRGRRAT